MEFFTSIGSRGSQSCQEPYIECASGVIHPRDSGGGRLSPSRVECNPNFHTRCPLLNLIKTLCASCPRG